MPRCHCCSVAQQVAPSTAALAQLSAAAANAFVNVYPFLHAGTEALRLGFQLAFLLDVGDVHSPVLWLLRQRLVRQTGAEMVCYMPRATHAPPGHSVLVIHHSHSRLRSLVAPSQAVARSSCSTSMWLCCAPPHTLAHLHTHTHTQAQLDAAKSARRADALAAAAQRTSPLMRGAHAWALRAGALAADHLRTALILSVFGFKVRRCCC